ncbi:MAG: hypothetical protein AAGF47_00480 [Planctomycetota bacterium]
MNRFRLRGTWEEDPTPIPFPAGREAGAEDRPAPADTDRQMSTDEVIETVEGELDRLTLRIDDLRRMVMPFDDGNEPDPAA